MDSGKPYQIPANAGIGHVHLKVSDLERSLAFYEGLLGFTVTQRYGTQAAFLSAGDYHHHIGLNTWYSRAGNAPARENTGLFHAAILYPDRASLAAICQRLLDNDYPLTGTADHGVSEAIYLDDPDGNGLELYWDRPPESWPRKADQSLEMYTRPLNLDALLSIVRPNSQSSGD